MSPIDPPADLEAQIAQHVERAVGRLRDELSQRLRSLEQRIPGGEERAEPAAAPAQPAPTAAPAASEPAAADSTAAELLAGVRSLDEAASQAEVLSALLEAAGRFASRSALFLVQEGTARGWGGYGFDLAPEEFSAVELAATDGAWAGVGEGRGTVLLDAAGCAALCRELKAPEALEGVLIPFVLRDRVAAALYADRLAADGELGVEALQLLTYTGAQAVEILSLRERASTPTLTVWERAPEEETVAIVPPPPEVEPVPPAEPEAGESADALAGFETVEADAPAEEAAATGFEDVELPMGGGMEMADELLETAAVGELGFEEAELPPVAGPPVPPPPVERPATQVAPPAVELPAVEPPAAEPSTAPPAAFEEPESATTELEPLVEPEASAPPPPAPAPPPAEPAPAVTEAPGQRESTQVVPPTDVEGPGWAFTATRTPEAGGDEANHEEARRLARLLVTEIKLYNEELVEEGRRHQDIYSRLKEDIDRSRQIFEERVDPTVREQADYFRDELVKILAGGNAAALGV